MKEHKQIIQQSRETIHDLNEKFNKERDIIRKNQTKILGPKNSKNEIKNAIESFNSKIDQTEEFLNLKTGLLK